MNSKELGLSASGAESPDERNARGLRFNPHRRIADKGLKRHLAAFIKFVETEEVNHLPRARRRKDADRNRFRLAVETLYANLLVLAAIAPGIPLEIRKSLNAIRKADSRRPEVYGEGFAQLLTLLALPEVGLLEEVQRGYRVGGRSQLSQFALADRLIRMLNVEGFQLNQIGLDAKELAKACIVLRDKKDKTTTKKGSGKPLDFSETAEVARMRRELIRVNRFLLQADFELLPLADGTYGFDDEAIPVDPTARAVVRIFNDGSFMRGGRLYHGFWENMPKAQRKERLRIQGETIATVDFGQLYPRLAYAFAGKKPPEGDLYDILGDGQFRTGWKRLVNAMLLSRHHLGGYPEETQENLPSGIGLLEAREAVYRRHIDILEFFECGAGSQFMFYESTILMKSLLECIRLGIVALPLHDAVLVADSHALIAKEVMSKHYSETTHGDRAVISIEK